MKIICRKKDLLSGVNIALRAIPARTTMDILQCIMIDASEGNIKLTATDMDMGIETIIDGNIEEGGQIALDAKLFSEIVRKLPDGDVVIDTDFENKALIVCEKAKFNISGRSGDEFVKIPDVERDNTYKISHFSLKDLIRQTIFAAGENDINPVFSGVLFEFKDSSLKVVALDGQRIAIRRIDLKEKCEKASVIVPAKTLSEISKILSGEMDEDVNIYISPLHMLFELKDTIVVTRLIEGEYFQVERMISSDYSSKVLLSRRDFSECIERSTLLLKESDRKPVVMNISDTVVKTSINTQIGSMNEEMEVDKEGKDIEIGFNPRFMMDTLRVIDDEKISMFMIDGRSPITIKNEEETYIYLVLPISLKQSI